MTVIRAQDEPPGPHDSAGTVIAAFRAVSPTFSGPWQELSAEWSPEPVPQYVAVGDFATHVVDSLISGTLDEFPAVFRAVEDLLHSDDPEIRYLVTWGFLEDLGNVAANRRDWPFAGKFRQWFGSLTTEAWDEVHRFWGTGGLE